ncbi:MAG: SIR2 family protein [Acidobacteria bacterium]|nr:SIR2 family protein [Acidobacteriota bacterium]
MSTQDPNKQVNYLQQCLSTDKKPIGFFLGAGCPMALKTGPEGKEPLIPDISGITSIVCDELTKCTEYGPLLSIMQEHFEKDGRTDVTVEDMLTHIRALQSVAGKDEVRGLSAEQLDKLDDRICQIIHQVADKTLTNSNTPYHQIAGWVDAVRRENPIEVFTTNYDLLMEQAFEDSRVPYFDGFAGVRKPFFDLRAMEEDMLPPRWARLWKLHGSVNWYQIENKGVFRGTAKDEGGTKRVIHPSHLKYQESRRMPYLAMIDRLRAFLKQPTATLILCGYSFRDEHINEIIIQGLQSNQSAIAFALLFNEINTYTQAIALASKRSNLNILAIDGAIIGSQESKWPEKDAELVSADTNEWIVWEPVDPEGQNGKHSAKFKLGDFAVFGQFINELVGNVRQTPEDYDA